jgi:hypothetical protein
MVSYKTPNIDRIAQQGRYLPTGMSSRVAWRAAGRSSPVSRHFEQGTQGWPAGRPGGPVEGRCDDRRATEGTEILLGQLAKPSG